MLLVLFTFTDIITDAKRESSPEPEEEGKALYIAIGASLGGLLLLSLIVIFFLVYKRKRTRDDTEHYVDNTIPMDKYIFHRNFLR